MFGSVLKRPLLHKCIRWQASKRQLSRADIKAREMLDKIYTSVRAQRFENIVVMQTMFNANPRYFILANAFSHRHLVNGTEQINKDFKLEIKTEHQEFARISLAEEWNVVDFDAVVVHLFQPECRERFDLDQLWSVGEEYDDLLNFPVEPAQPLVEARIGITE